MFGHVGGFEGVRKLPLRSGRLPHEVRVSSGIGNRLEADRADRTDCIGERVPRAVEWLVVGGPDVDVVGVSRRDLIEGGLTASVIGAFFEVYNVLGFGFLEQAYSVALESELRVRGHTVERQVGV